MPTADAPTLGWSKFALSRHMQGTGYSYFVEHSHDDVAELVRQNWSHARPGDGESECGKKVVVPIPAKNFYCTSVLLQKDMTLHSDMYEHNGHLAIKTVADADAVPAKFVNVVCFSAHTVSMSFGERSGTAEWEIVVILAAESQDVPMHPLSMARNLLDEHAGAESKYTAREFAESVQYWSQRVQVGGK